MANALQQQMADDIASLVRKQTFSGSGVWRQSGNATLRIQTQTNAIIEALGRIPSKETQEEEEREDDRQHAVLVGAIQNLDVGSEGSDDSKKGGFFKKMLSGIVGFPIKMVKGLFSALGSVGKLFKKFGSFLLKPLSFIGTLGGALTGTVALVSGLSAIAALFAGVAITSFMLTDAEFDKLKEDIAKGVAHVFSEIVAGAVKVYNAFMPEGMKVSPEDEKKFKEATFVTLKDSIISIIDFVKGITDSFGAGFLDASKTIKDKNGKIVQEGLDIKVKNFVGAFNNFSKSLGETTERLGKALGELFKNFEVKVDGVTYKGLMGEKSLSTLMGYLTGKLAGGILDFSTAVLNFLADPTKGIEKIIDDFLFNLSELFSKASLVRMAESYGIGAVVPDFFREEAANEQIARAMAAGRGLIPFEQTVAKPMTVEDFGSFSVLNLLKDLNQGAANYTMRLVDDAGRIIEITNDAIRDSILKPEDLLQTGVAINGLQMERIGGGTTGSTGTVVVDQSQQPTIINQTNVNPPLADGPRLVGEGRDRFNLRQ